VEKCGRARQITDEYTKRRMHIAQRMSKAINSHLNYVILITYEWQQWFF